MKPGARVVLLFRDKHQQPALTMLVRLPS